MVEKRRWEEYNQKSCTKKKSKTKKLPIFNVFKISLRTIKYACHMSPANAAIHISRMLFGLG